MSCEFHLTATLEGISKFLDEEKTGNFDTEPDDSRKTLRSFKIAISPTGELVVFAKSTWLLICVSKWETSDDARIKYKPNWHGHVACNPGEEITSLYCLPFFSQGQSSLGCADWTCIILGFSSGCIRFYTERMQELGCSILHEEKITGIKSFYPVQFAQQSKHQNQENGDIYVLYKTVICILNKAQLKQTLHNKRNQLAKGVPTKKSEAEIYLPVDLKKYSFIGQEEVTDACFLGQALVSSFNTFDHLVTASLIGGFNSNFRASPPQTSLIVSSGRRPFVGFHYTHEGGNSPVLSDVALAVASKIKNSVTSTLPDWFNFGSKKSTQSEKPKEVSQEYAEKLNCRFGLCDLWRQGESVVVSPDGAFSAVSDSLGRVTLVDNASGIAHNLWKGYRDAQCGFIQVQEDIRKLRKMGRESSSKPQPRQGLFLVIYAPKKGVIEIFTTQHGSRVTIFKVTKYGHLIYNPSARNVQNVSAGGFSLIQNQVVFVSEDGFNEFSIPFHCALAEENSKISRDLHVLKKLKMLLKMESNSNTTKFAEEIEKNAREIKTDEVRLQAIESMITYRNVTLEAFKTVLKVFLEALQNEGVDPRPKKIFGFAEATLNLLLFYEFVTSLNDSKPNAVSSNENMESTKNTNSIFEELRLPQNELEMTLKAIRQITDIERIKQQTTKVAFQEKSSKLVQFLSCFDFESFLGCLDKNEAPEEKENHPCLLNLKSNGKENSISHLGQVFYKGLFNSFSSFEKWKKFVRSCCLNPKDLALCLLSFWCNKKMPDEIFPELLLLMEVLKMICSLKDVSVVAGEYNAESPWWKELRSFIAGNPFAIPGLYAALCCRSVTIFVEQEREFSLGGASEKKQASKVDEDSTVADTSMTTSDWETMSKDCCQWDILIMQLQDVALLNAVLSLTFRTESSVSEIPFDFEPQCLTAIQLSGTGRVSELVAKWLAQFGFQPSALVEPKDLEFQMSSDGMGTEKEKSELVFAIDKANEARNESLNSVQEYLALLKSRFPYSLTSSSLLGNMSWEYFAHWFKNISDVQYLETAVQYLEVIPASRIKYGIGCLSWNTYLEQKFETLAKMINRIGKVPVDKLCVQEIGLRNEQVSVFLKLVGEVLKILLHTDVDDKSDFENNREALWQNSSTPTTSLVFIALSQTAVNGDLILYQLQLSVSLLMMSSLNIKHPKVFSSLFDDAERLGFTQGGTAQLSSHYQNVKLKDSRTEFLKKCITAAIQTVELVEYIPPASLDEISEVVPSTRFQVESYKKWLQTCFELAGVWALGLDDLRKHQVCELYSCGFDRLAEEVISSVNDTAGLASRLLVLGGKRLKYLIQESHDLSKKLTKLSANLSEWLDTLDLRNFTYHGSTDDIEVLMRYTAQWLREDCSEQKLAVAVVESLTFLKLSKNT